MSAPPDRSSPVEARRELQPIIEQLRALLPCLRQRYRVDHLSVFGSYVRHEQTPSSDVDVLVEFEAPISLYRQVEL